MKRAYIYPGQGSQYVGMAKDLFDEYELAREYFQKANEIMGVSLSDIAFNGPGEVLTETRYTQPVIFVHSVIVYELLKTEGYRPEGVAGHSLGEYSVLVAAGVLNFEEALKLVKLRGQLMHEAGTIQPGTMAAIIGMDIDKIDEICTATTGIVVPANFNSPGQIVISGEIGPVREAMASMKDSGAKIVKELVVSGAFHSPLMEKAISGLEEALRTAPMKDAAVPVYQNADALPHRDKEKIRENVLSQLTAPVRWHESMLNMVSDGFDDFLEIGPSSVLKGLLRRIDRSVKCTTVGGCVVFELSGN